MVLFVVLATNKYSVESLRNELRGFLVKHTDCEEQLKSWYRTAITNLKPHHKPFLTVS